MSRQPPSRGEVGFILGVPAAWAILLLFHPGGEPDTIYLNLQDVVDRFLVVHIGMLIFIPLFAAAVYVLMRDVEGTAAQVSRIALIPFVIFYGAFETLQGIGVGTLVDELNGYRGHRFHLREWWVVDWADVTPRDVWRWFLRREAWSVKGTLDEWLYVRDDSRAGVDAASP